MMVLSILYFSENINYDLDQVSAGVYSSSDRSSSGPPVIDHHHLPSSSSMVSVLRNTHFIIPSPVYAGQSWYLSY